MKGRIQSQSGVSLSETYQFDDSSAGPQEVHIDDGVFLVDELGSRTVSERLTVIPLRITSVATAASTNFNTTFNAFPDCANRILGVTVLSNETARVTHAQLSIQEPVGGEEVPFWVWDTAHDVDRAVRWSDSGAAVGDFFVLTPALYQMPSLVARIAASDVDRATAVMPQIILRGTTEAFGAGTVQVFAMVLVARPDPGTPAPGEPSSYGLPLPGW